jgi:hypothetical protein
MQSKVGFIATEAPLGKRSGSLFPWSPRGRKGGCRYMTQQAMARRCGDEGGFGFTSSKDDGTVWKLFAEAQERQAQLTQSFFEASEELVEQARRGQEEDRVLTQEPAKDYRGFLDSLFILLLSGEREAG